MNHRLSTVGLMLLAAAFVDLQCSGRTSAEQPANVAALSRLNGDAASQPASRPAPAGGPLRFGIIADRTGGPRDAIFEQGIAKLNLLQPEFVLCVGDLIEGYTEKPDDLAVMWTTFDGIAARFDAPFLRIPGNHDATNALMAKEYERHNGPLFYSFRHKDALFLCLNAVFPKFAALSDEQVEFVRGELAKNKDARWTFVFLHVPLWHMTGETNWPKVQEMLMGRPHTVFAGHEHRYTYYSRNGNDYIALGTTGGSTTPGDPELGFFDHVMMVTMAADAPRIAVLPLSGVLAKDFTTEASQKLVDSVRNGVSLQAEPLLVRGGSFDTGTTSVRLTNRASLPARLTGTLSAGPGVQVRPAGMDERLAAGSGMDFAVRLDAAQRMPVGDVPPAALKWTAVYDLPGGKSVKIDGLLRLGPVAEAKCPATSGPVVLDGKLDEWGDLPIVCRKPAQVQKDAAGWTGPDDCSFRFGTRYDKDNLYIAIDVTDDAVLAAEGKNAWDQDGVEIRLDARDDPARSNGGSQQDEAGKKLMVLTLSPAGAAKQTLAQGVQAAWAKTPTGYAVELSVPARLLDRAQGKAWQAFRLNVAADDQDAPGGPVSQIWWQSDWRSPESLVGSGTFVRGE